MSDVRRGAADEPAAAASAGPIPIARPLLGDDELAAVAEVLADRWVGQGPRVQRLEALLAQLCGTGEAVAVSSGTAALQLSLLALGLGPGDRVAVPSFTFVASANAVLLSGARPLLIDCDPATFNVDVDDLRRQVERVGGVAAIMPVHQFGLPCDLEAVQQIAAQHGALLVEDAACAVGASWRGRPAGSIGRAGCLSFHPRKVVTSGEGGAVLTDDGELARQLRILRSHGMDPETDSGGGMADVVRLGYNLRMSDLQAAVGLVQLGRLEDMRQRRAALARRYLELLSDVPWLALPGEPADPAQAVHGWQSFVVRVRSGSVEQGFALREALRSHLAAQGVATRPGTHAVHALRLYREQLGYAPRDLPGAWEADRLSLALPLFEELTDEQLVRVADLIRGFRAAPG